MLQKPVIKARCLGCSVLSIILSPYRQQITSWSQMKVRKNEPSLLRAFSYKTSKCGLIVIVFHALSHEWNHDPAEVKSGCSRMRFKRSGEQKGGGSGAGKTHRNQQLVYKFWCVFLLEEKARQLTHLSQVLHRLTPLCASRLHAQNSPHAGKK